MKREIKFRAWLKDVQEMIPVHDIKFNGNIGLINTQLAWRMFNEIELMQFTGLHDQNGKEIYEGDICRDEDGLGVIYWEKDCWMYGFVLFDSSYKSDGYMLREMADDCEIIGNIYENHELLEVPHDTKI